MEFHQLRYIVEIVETGSISRAATNLYLSQPNLSNQIQKLESEIGKEIFHRTNRGVTLTPYGMEVYHHAKSLVRHFEMTENRLLTRVNEHMIKIASFGSEVINHQFFEICRRYNQENVSFELYEVGIEEAVDKVSGRICDLGIIIYSDFQSKKLDGFLAAEGLEKEDLFSGQMMVHMSTNHELSLKPRLTRGDLEALFHVKKTYFFQGMFTLEQELRFLGVPETAKVLMASGNKTYNDALHALPSFALEIDWKCKKKIHSDLARIPFEDQNLRIHCAMVKRKNEILREELQFFVEKLIDSYN